MHTLIVLVLVAAVVEPSMPEPSQEQHSSFSSAYGVTGAIQTPNAFTAGRGHGRVGVFESFTAESEDQVFFVYTVVDALEVGLQSDIPSVELPRLNFFFKLMGFQQDSFFVDQPATSFGISRQSAFANLGWQLSDFEVNAGYQFSDRAKGAFANVGYTLFGLSTVQLEYDSATRAFGAALRVHYKVVQASLTYSSGRPFTSRGFFWSLAYAF